MSSLLKEKRALAKLREELEGRKGKLCRCYKGFGHLARNCRKLKEGVEGTVVSRNKFEVLRSRVMQCRVEERVVRNVRMVVVRCFKCGKEGHKCRECPLWEKKVKRVVRPNRGRVHQQERRPARPIREKAQEGEKRLRRMKKEKAARPVKREAQQEWRRSLWEELRKRAEWYCGPTVPQDAELWELGWCGQGAIVMYLKCPRCGEGGCHVEDNWGQGVVPYWRREKMSWCGCRGKEEQSSVRARDSRSAAREEKAAWPREAEAQQSSTWSREPESTAREGGSRKEVRRTFKMLREVWLNIGVEKIDTHEGVMIKALLDSDATGMFIDK